jgi:hypothetical protein
MSLRFSSLGLIALLLGWTGFASLTSAETAVHPPDPGPAAEHAESALVRARALYDDAKFNEAAQLLAEAIQDGRIHGDDLEPALELRARCLVKAGKRVEAKEGFLAILHANPGYRADPNAVPPDEIEVYNQALKEFRAEQVEIGKRYPSSIGFWYGMGQAVNQDMSDLASSAGVEAADDFEASGEFGYSVRFPIKPRWSIDVELSRLHAVTEDKLPPERNAHGEYTVSGLPIVVSLMRHFGKSPKLNLSALAGAGFMPSEGVIEFQRTLVSGRLIPTQILGRSTGAYLHAGVEAEYHLWPRFAIAARGVGRYAKSGNLDFPRRDFEVYETFPESVLGDRTVDFSGLAAHIGVRAYIGY